MKHAPYLYAYVITVCWPLFSLRPMYMYGGILCVEYRSDIIRSADVINSLQALLMPRWRATVMWDQVPRFTVEQAGTLCATITTRVMLFLDQ